MARHRDMFSTALSSLRLRAVRAEYRPGQSVVVIDEARRLRLSTTPVREALACLCGEGLFERSPHEGFLYPRLDAGLIRDRLAFRLGLLQAALEARSSQALRAPAGADGAPVLLLQQQFSRVIRAGGNQAALDAYRRVAAQLSGLRKAERRVFGDVDQEALGLLSSLARGEAGPAVAAYHRRRSEAASLLLLDLEGDAGQAPGKG